ncbi:MAG: hypothetical protein V1778_02450 [bacterium]
MDIEKPDPFEECHTKPNEEAENNKDSSILNKATLIDRKPPDSEPFREEIRETLIRMSNEVVDGVQVIFDKPLQWTLEFWYPKSADFIRQRKERVFRDTDSHHEFDSDDYAALDEAGLQLGGLDTSEEDDARGRSFLAERVMNKTGELQHLTEGHANLCLHKDKGTIQIDISTSGYTPKYRSQMGLSEVIDFIQADLTKQAQ